MCTTTKTHSEISGNLVYMHKCVLAQESVGNSHGSNGLKLNVFRHILMNTNIMQINARNDNIMWGRTATLCIKKSVVMVGPGRRLFKIGINWDGEGEGQGM